MLYTNIFGVSTWNSNPCILKTNSVITDTSKRSDDTIRIDWKKNKKKVVHFTRSSLILFKHFPISLELVNNTFYSLVPNVRYIRPRKAPALYRYQKSWNIDKKIFFSSSKTNPLLGIQPVSPDWDFLGIFLWYNILLGNVLRFTYR